MIQQVLLVLLVFTVSPALSVSLVVDISNATHPVSPTLFGIFFEEINHAGEGGLYGELVRNRNFNANGLGGASVQVSLSPAANPYYSVRHCDFYGYVSPISSTQDEQDSTFSMASGLNGKANYVSFQSINFPGYYLRHYNFRLMLAQNDDSAQFAQDASFLPIAALDGSKGVSFQSSNYPSYYLMVNSSDDGPCTQIQSKFDIFLAPLQNNPTFHTNATFYILSPNLNPYVPWTVIQEGGAITDFSLDESNPLTPQAKQAGKIVASGYSSSTSYSGISNPGFWGINAKPDTYSFSFFGRSSNFVGELIVTLESMDGSRVYGKVLTTKLTDSWQQYSYSLVVGSGVADKNARLAIRLSAPGTVWLDVVSLFPSTYKSRKNGMRQDLAVLIEEMEPKFVRFPGGCYVEGSSVSTAYLWKNSTGPLQNRPGHNSFWGYWSTDGLGYLEYLQLCEDIGAAPIFVLHIGIFTGDSSIPFNALGPWIQDALDAIEYATGSTSTTWGAKRGQDGHPDPFPLNIVALGNENGCGFDVNGIYVKYFNAFATRVKAAYPNMQIIANCDISGQTGNVDYYDVHLYNSPTWFVTNANMFDGYKRSGPKAFVSEYAVTSDCGNGNLQAAVAEAAFMTGLVRNSDIVALASYAPLFVNVNNRAWNPDAIQFDSGSTSPTPSYYVQALFAKYTGAYVVGHTLYGAPSGLASVATYDKATQSLYIPIVNFSPSSVVVPITIKGTTSIQKSATVYVLTASNPLAENSIANPNAVVPSTNTISASTTFSYTAAPYSVSILAINAM